MCYLCAINTNNLFKMTSSNKRVNLIISRLAVVLGSMSVFCGAQSALAGGHNTTFGIEGGYNSRYDTPVAGIFFNYNFTDHFRLGADADIAFRSKNYDAFLLDVDAHFPFVKSSVVEFYPIAGVNFSTWSHHIPASEIEDTDDVTTRTSNFGINLGAGVGFRVTQTLKINIQARYTLIEAKSGARITAGIGYIF